MCARGLCGASGLLEGKCATTHWTAMDVLPYYGAIPTNERVVMDGAMISTGGVTAGIDGSLHVVSLLRGLTAAEEVQLYMAYDPKHLSLQGRLKLHRNTCSMP